MRGIMVTVTAAWLATGCGGDATSTGDPDTHTDTLQDTTVTDTAGDPLPDTVTDTAGDSSVDVEVECSPVPPGCVDVCLDGDGMESYPWGVTARTCVMGTDEHGCPFLDFANTDCAPGVCYLDLVDAACVAPVTCESAACTCPEGASCDCARTDCTVTCEGDCMVELSGDGGTVECAADAWCLTRCTGTDCTTNCNLSDECTQDCEGPGECTCNGCT